MFCGSSIRVHIVILRNYKINTCIRILHSPIFSNQAGVIVFLNRQRAYCGVLRLTETSYLRSDSPRTSPRNETVKPSGRQMTVANAPVQRPSWTWCRTWWNHPWHRNLKSALFCLHSSAHSPGVYHFANSESQRCFWLLPIGIDRATPTASFDSWATSVFLGLHGDRTVGGDWCKNKFQIREYSPKTINIVGFLHHISANSMYKTITRLVNN